MSKSDDSTTGPNIQADSSNAVIVEKMKEVLREKLPDEPVEPEKLATAIAQFLSVEIQEIAEFRGPMPPPKMLAEYEQVLPGLAGRIADRADREQTFRHESTKHAQDSERIQIHYGGISTVLGQVFGFLIGMTAVGGGIYLLANDKSIAGLVSIITGLGALVAVFITGKLMDVKRSSEDERSSD